MSYPGFTYSYEYGTVRETTLFIGARLDPSIDDVDDFAILLFFELPSGEVVHVAKIDNTDRHDGEIHIHRNYREETRRVRDFDIDVETWHEAEDLIAANAERWAIRYLDVHGRKKRTDL